jgi:hypothetical protein
MAEKKKKRIRRTDEQLIQDLQEEIERLRKRAQTRKAKRSPSLKHTLAAVRAIDMALETASDASLKLALQNSREYLSAYLKMEGVPLPKRKGRRPKAKEPAPEPEETPRQGRSRSAVA